MPGYAMDLCQTITVDRDLCLHHDFRPSDFHVNTPPELILMPPKNFSHRLYALAALKEPGEMHLCDLALPRDMGIAFHMTIVDDLEKKPLFFNHSANRALLMLGEMANCMADGLKAFGFTFQKLFLGREIHSLVIQAAIPRGCSAFHALGGFICFGALIDGLLCERGLGLSSKKLLSTTETQTKSELFLAMERLWAFSDGC
jgi:hypothetical protein